MNDNRHHATDAEPWRDSKVMARATAYQIVRSISTHEYSP